jgi:hypothetical protein
LATQFQFATSSRAGVCPFERHFKPEEPGKLWGLSANATRALFEDEAGVQKSVALNSCTSVNTPRSEFLNLSPSASMHALMQEGGPHEK